MIVRSLLLCLALSLLATLSPALFPGRAWAQSDTEADDAATTEAGAVAKGGEPDAASMEQARKHFQRGVELYADGDIGGALVEFEHAYRLHPSFRLLYNLGQVSAELLDYVKAEQYFVRYLKEGGAEIDPERRIEVEAELERLHKRIGTVTVETSEPDAEVFVDDVSVGEAPLQGLPVSAGQRRIRVQKTGFETVTRMVNIIGGQTQSVRIELTPTALTQTSYNWGPEAPANTPAIIATVITGALLAGTAGTAYWAYLGNQDYDDELDRSTTRKDLDELASTTERRALISDVLLGATIASAVVTTILWLNGPDETEEVADEGTLEVGLGSIRGTF